jgi:hypothetical protein
MLPALHQWQHTILSAVNFVAFLTNFLVAFAPLPQAILVHQVKSSESLHSSAPLRNLPAAQERWRLEDVGLSSHMRQLPIRDALCARD